MSACFAVALVKVKKTVVYEAIAKKTMLGEKAQTLAKETGARVYWEGASKSKARIASDTVKFDELNAMLQ